MLQRSEVAIPLLEQAVNAASLRGSEQVQFVVNYARRLIGPENGLGILRRVLAYASDPNAVLAMRITLAKHLVTAADAAQRQEGLDLTTAIIAAVPKGSTFQLDALLVQAVGWEFAEEHQQAAQCYEQILGLVPDDARALNNLAFVLADNLGRAAEALPYAERLGELVSEDTNILDTIGWVYFKNGKTTPAVAAFREALRIEPENLPARYHLGEVYAARGQRPDAEREFDRVLRRAREVRNKRYEKKAEEALARVR
jgi:tetratricopeptide (TPR) repeat protein